MLEIRFFNQYNDFLDSVTDAISSPVYTESDGKPSINQKFLKELEEESLRQGHYHFYETIHAYVWWDGKCVLKMTFTIPLRKKKSISMRTKFGSWKYYEIDFENSKHWHNWIEKMWGFGYKLESVFYRD